MSRERPYELQHAQVFVKYLNQKHSLDYEAYNYPDEDSEIDAYATSVSGKPQLNFQNVYSGGEFEKTSIQNMRKNEDEEMKRLDVEPHSWIFEGINKKEKEYPEDVKKNIILLVEGYIPTPLPEEVKSIIPENFKSGFLGVYYVQPKATKDGTFTGDGFVIPFKDNIGF